MWDKAIEYWKTLKTDDDAVFDKEVTIKAEDLEPYVTWGTNPGQGIKISGVVPDPASFNDETERTAAERAIAYMGLTPGMRIKDIAVDTVFIGSCTNGRLEDLRVAASIMKGHHKAENIHRVLVVPASSRVRLQAEKEGLDKIFKDFGAEWRNAGCSMCLGMNPDKMVARERSISTSNRNFEGRVRIWRRRRSPPQRPSAVPSRLRLICESLRMLENLRNLGFPAFCESLHRKK